LIPGRASDFCLLHNVQTGAHSPGVRRPGREPDYSPPTSAEVKKTRIYTSTPPYVFNGVVLN
jgi:hypothetical protein